MNTVALANTETGKTRRRAGGDVDPYGTRVDPIQIAAVPFTGKAAMEMDFR